MDYETTDIAVLSTAGDGLVQPMVVDDSCSNTTTTTTSKFASDVVKENSDDTMHASSSSPFSLSLPLGSAEDNMVTAESDQNHHHPGTLHPSIYSWGRSDLHCLFHHADAQHKDGIYSSSYSSNSSGSNHHEGSSKNFIFIASNLYHSAALTSTGELYTTGDNSEGQVRDNSCSATDESEDDCLMTSSSTTSKRKPQIVESLATQRISSVACGSNHTVCVTASGCAISFGGNECGQLGHSVDKISHVAPRMTTFAVHRSVHGHAGVVVKKVACGDLFTLFLSTTGEVYGCGSSIYLGNNIATTTTIRPTATAKLTVTTKDRKTSDDDGVLQATNVCPAQRIDGLVSLHIIDITAGSTHSMAITATGELYTWGANNQFQLGYDCSSSSSIPQQHHHSHQQLPRKVLFEAHYGPLQVVGIKAGYQHSIVWTDQGLLLGCGANKYGQLGLPSPRVESFTVIPLDYSCTMAACGYNHTLALCDSSKRISSCSSSCSGDLIGSMTEIGAASTVLYGFGANNNNQVSGSTTLSMIRSPMALNDNLKVWSISKIHYIAAGGDQSFVIADTSDGPTAVMQLDTSSSQQQHDHHHLHQHHHDQHLHHHDQHQFPLRKQFSTLVSKSVEPMSSASMCSLLLKAKKEKAKESRNDDHPTPTSTSTDPTVTVSMQSDSSSPDDSLMTNQPHHHQKTVTSTEYTYALSAVLEIFSSPSLLGGSFLRESSSLLPSSLPSSSLPSSSIPSSSIPSSSLPLPTWSSFEQSLDVQGLENCYVTLMQLGSEVSARLLAATQQAITELEHAVQKAPLGACSISSSMQAALVKVVMILWQNPLMANPKLSLDLFTRLMIIASGTCQKKYELMVDVFRCYPQHILVARVLKPLQEHLSFHLQAWQSDPTGALVMTSKRRNNNNNKEEVEEDDILTLLSSFLKSLYDHHSHSNNKEPYLTPDLFYNPQIDRFNDLMLMKDCLDWQKKQGKNTFTIHNTSATTHTTSTIPTDPNTHRFYFSQYPFLLSIDVKLRMLNSELQMHHQFAQQRAVNFGLFSGMNIIQPWFVLQVQREHLLQQTLIHIAGASTIDLKKPLKVVFVGEEGVDAGGVKKELFQLLISQLFSDQYGMFHTAASGRVLWITHTNRWCSDEYKLVGTLLALAVYNGVLLDVQLPPVFYRKLLQQQPAVQSSLMEDLKGIDPELHTGLLQLLHFEPAMEVEYVFCKNFVVEWDEYGAPMSKKLIEDGKSVAVTADNRQLYVDKLLDWTLNESISEQFSSLMEGFHRIINPSMIEHFTALELERLMTGLPHLDFKELEESTEYVGDSTWTTEHPMITAFWSIIHSLPFEDKQKFLLFVTGSNKAPVGGLKKLNLRIQRMGPHSDSLPTAHTCFNTLLLPEYSSSEVLKDRLLKAIHECEGFGLK